MALSQKVRARLEPDAAQIIGRYPQSRSALLPLLHLVQAEEGYVSEDGIEFCAEQLGLAEAEVTAVVSFYTMYKRGPVGEYHVGVCTNSLCAVMGGDAIFADLQEHLGVGNDETTAGRQGQPGAPGVQRGLRLRAGGHGELGVLRQHDPAVGPGPGGRPADRRRASQPTRGAPRLCTWQQASRILAGFPDGQAAEGHTAGEPSLAGLRIAKEQGWTPDGGPAGNGGAAVTTILTPELTAYWDEPDSFTLAGYRRARRLPGAAQGPGHAAGPGHPDREGLGAARPRRGRLPDRRSSGGSSRKGDGKPHYLVVNADESEPGACKDMPTLLNNPQALIEGIVIACYAIDAHRAFIYVRGEVLHVIRRVHHAVTEAYQAGYLGRTSWAPGSTWR